MIGDEFEVWNLDGPFGDIDLDFVPSDFQLSFWREEIDEVIARLDAGSLVFAFEPFSSKEFR